MYRSYKMATNGVDKSGKNVLIIFAHENRTSSYNGAMLDAAVSSLEGQGHQVTVSDLHGLGFDPVISERDITDGARDPGNFNYLREITGASKRGTIAPQITAEIEKWENADLIIFQFPIFWGGMPAILKGYFDRVFVRGAVHSYEMMFQTGKFWGKRALVSITTGGPGELYTDTGLLGNIDVLLWPLLNMTLRYVGLDVLPVHAALGVLSRPREQLEQALQDWGRRLQSVFQEKPIVFPSSTAFGGQESGKSLFLYQEEKRNGSK